MKNLIYVILIFLFFVSCKNETPQTIENSYELSESEIKAIENNSDSIILKTETVEKVDMNGLNYIFIGSNSYVEFFGASQNDQWFRPDQVMDYLKENDMTINIFGAYLEQKNVQIKSDFIIDEICDCISFNLVNTDFSSSLIGISGDWDIYSNQATDGYEYIDVANEHLSKFLLNEGISKPVLKIESLELIDFNNDGKEDIIFEAVHDSLNERYMTLKGSYSVIMVISDINELSKEIVVCKTIYKQDIMDEMNALVPFEIIDICDLNGDNIQELIISSGYYEGGGSDIFTFRNGKFEGVLGCMCGT